MNNRRLWDKGAAIDTAIHAFTVGNDHVLDLALLRWDAIGSAAHVHSLVAGKLLRRTEGRALLGELKRVLGAADRGAIPISRELEDCHTAIELRLTRRLGEVGKKVHTGRSRNDQVLTALRLYGRDAVVRLMQGLADLASTLESRSARLFSVPLPGYTHLQRAMPSSMGMWLQSYVEGCLQRLVEGRALSAAWDSSPLGAGSGFGVPLPLKREVSARRMGFAAPQRNPVAVQNSRGQMELSIARWCADGAALIEKLACDMLLFSTEEFGFFAIPEAFTTGSSIMPQKRNPDVLELMRGRASRSRAHVAALEGLTAKLPSSYHRDFQLTKDPFMRAVEDLAELLGVARAVVSRFSVRRDKIEAAMSPELFATYDAYRAVVAGVPFRDAYRATAERTKAGMLNVASLRRDYQRIERELRGEARTAARLVRGMHSWLRGERRRLDRIERSIFGS